MNAASAAPSELFARVRAIQIRAQRLVRDMGAGDYESRFKGRGMQFNRVREYQPGDDVRHIDWNVTARMQAPYVKEYNEERQLTVMLLVDVSASQTFGTQHTSKMQLAIECAAVLAYAAVRSHDRVGLIAFSDRVEQAVMPRRGRAHVWRVIRDILALDARRPATRIAAALDHLQRMVPKRAVTFIISDWIDPHFIEPLCIAARRHDITAVHIGDRHEVALPNVGLVSLVDLEGGARVCIDLGDAQVRHNVYRCLQADAQARARGWAKARVPSLQLMTGQPYIAAMAQFFCARPRRARAHP